jgi:transcription initiation factor TFIIH subunit 1
MFLCLYKKIQGNVSISDSLITFDSTLTIDINNIKSQQINVAGKSAKVLWKIVTTEDTFNFTFVGRDAVADREKAKGLLANLLKTRLTPGDIKCQQALLQEPDIKLIHKELVDGRFITETDFWTAYDSKLQDERFKLEQRKGQSNSSLVDIRPAQDTDANELKYTLNPEIIHSIFMQYPSVHKAYKDHVPEKVQYLNKDE